MSIQRLRRVLNAQFTVAIDSSAATVQLIAEKITDRSAAVQAKNKIPPPTKAPTSVASLAAITSIAIRPVDLLRKIGDLTTPSGVNMASLSASWATRRYFWAIAEPHGSQFRFRLSQDARDMDFHQKTLLSDEFGIGFGGLVLERLFNASQAIDVSAALQNPGQYQNVVQFGRAQPDYLMWGSAANSPYYVVECKGCQTRLDVTLNQIRRGLEQVPSLVFGTGPRQVTTLVVASHMQPSRTTIYVIDPPNDPPDYHDKRDPVSERIAKNTWRVNNPAEFAKRVRSAKQTKLLNWAGQFASARVSSEVRGTVAAPGETTPDLELFSKTIAGFQYRGRRVALFPELGYRKLQVFTGVREDVLDSAKKGADEPAPEQAEPANVQGPTDDMLEVNESVGRDDTCLVLEGI